MAGEPPHRESSPMKDTLQDTSEQNISESKSKDFEKTAVADSAKKGFISLFAVMMGFTFFSASMSVGAKLGNGLGLTDFAIAIVAGGTILLIYTGFLAYVGSKTGLSMDLLAHRSFGSKGSFLPSLMISITQIGWFGVGVAMFAYPVSELLGVNVWIIIIAAGAAMTFTSWWGIDAIEIVSIISVPLIAILGIYSMGLAITDAGGVWSVFANSGGMSMFTAIGLVVGSFISGGTATPNFVRFAKSPKSAVIATGIAFFIGNSLMFLFGAVGGAYTGQEDIFYVMIVQGLAVPAIIVLGANIWTTNNNALYSAGLGLANVSRKRKRPMTLIGGIVGTLGAIWLYNNFITWLNVLNATLPPIGIILTLDYFFHKERYAKENATPLAAVRPASIIGVIAGALVANLLPFGIASINAMVIAAACYFIGEIIERLRRSPQTSQEKNKEVA